MTTFKKQFIFFITVLCVQANATPFSFGLNRSAINVGERATLEVRLDIPKDADDSLLPEVDDRLLKQNEKLLLLQNDMRREEGQFVFRYDFTSYQVDKYAIAPISIKLGANTYSTESLPLQVSTLRTENDSEMRPEASSISAPLPLKKILTFLFWIACAGAVAIFCIRLLKKIPWERFSLPKQDKPREPKINPKLWLRAEMDRIRKKVEESPLDSLMDEVTYAVKKFSSLTTKEPALSLTTMEMETAITLKAKDVILEILKEYDFYKFAPSKNYQLKNVVLTGTEKITKTLCGT